jgi:hypothetical protein
MGLPGAIVACVLVAAAHGVVAWFFTMMIGLIVASSIAQAMSIATVAGCAIGALSALVLVGAALA